MKTKPKTPEKIKDELHELSTGEVEEIICALGGVTKSLSEIAAVSRKAERALGQLTEAINSLEEIQTFLQDFPIEEIDMTGQPIG